MLRSNESQGPENEATRQEETRHAPKPHAEASEPIQEARV